MFTDNVDYVPVGCYKDETSNRTLPELLENYRVKTTKYPDVLDWEDLGSSVIQRCAVKVCCVVCFISQVETSHYERLQSITKNLLFDFQFHCQGITRIQSVVNGECSIYLYTLQINLGLFVVHLPLNFQNRGS